MRIELLDDLYQRTLNQLLDGEKQMVRMLPKVQKAVSDPEMASLFGRHTAETKKQIERLERLLGKKPAPRAAKAEAISGLLAELKAILDRRLNDPDVLDAALAEAATQIEGHEISAYACAHKYAKFLGRRTDMKLLEQSFREEQQMEDAVLGFGEIADEEEAETEAEGASAR